MFVRCCLYLHVQIPAVRFGPCFPPSMAGDYLPLCSQLLVALIPICGDVTTCDLKHVWIEIFHLMSNVDIMN